MELLITNRRTGQVWDIAPCTQWASWTTNRRGSPGVFRFVVCVNGGVSFVEGDTVQFSVDGKVQFFGWVFTKIKNQQHIIQVTCYDRLRYLKAKASYAFYYKTAGEMIARIAGDVQIPLSSSVSTSYVIPSLIVQGQSRMDIIEQALEQTLLHTGKRYVLYDDGQGLALADTEKWEMDQIIGDGSLLLDYAYKTDIDTQTVNSVYLLRCDGRKGFYDEVTVQDTETIAIWGLLQYYQRVDSSQNRGQVQAQAEMILRTYNHRLRTLTVSALGVPGLRAGQQISMQVQNLGDIHLNQKVLLERVCHRWENDLHTMEFETLIPEE